MQVRSSASCFGAIASGHESRLGRVDLSTCLDVYTNLEAGADIADKELTSAQQACRRAQTTTLTQRRQAQDRRVQSISIGEELQRRGK